MTSDRTARLRRLLEPRSIAVVGASERPGSFGNRMTTEILRSPSAPKISLVHPGYTSVHGHPCVPSLQDLDEPVDLVVLGVPDGVLPEQLRQAARRGDGAGLIFGSAPGLGPELASIAGEAGMAVCGGGGMGYVNVARGVRAIGYVERFPLTPGGVAFVTHSGSVFSALLRTHRRLELSVAVSAGQELVTTMADYLDYALDLDETRVVGLFVETLRDAERFTAGLARAVELDIPVVALTAGGSPTGRSLVAAHSGAVAGDDAAWEALFSAYGVHRVESLDELVDTLEMFAIGRRLRPGSPTTLATVHDSGGERALIADRAHALGVTFADLSAATQERIASVLDPGLMPTNPLDVWGRGAQTELLFETCLRALADDDGVGVVSVGLDLVEEYDGDDSYPRAVQTVLTATDKPLIVLSNVAAALDQHQATRLRALGVPVLEGTESGLRALRHLFDQAVPVAGRPPVEVDVERRGRWRARLAEGELDTWASLELLRDYGIPVARSVAASTAEQAREAADSVGYPVVLKSDASGVQHRTELDGVRLGLVDGVALTRAYDEVARRLGPKVVVQPQLGGGVELALGVVRDPLLGPLVVVAIGGTLVEVIAQRQIVLPPLTMSTAGAALDRVPALRALLGGVRGRPPVDRVAVVRAVVAIGQLAVELGDALEALDVNPLICGETGATAVDCLAVRRPDSS